MEQGYWDEAQKQTIHLVTTLYRTMTFPHSMKLKDVRSSKARTRKYTALTPNPYEAGADIYEELDQ